MSNSSLAMAVGFLVLVTCVVGCVPAPDQPENRPVTPTSDPPVSPREPAAEHSLTPPDADLKALVDGNNAFAIDLYKQLAKQEEGNLLFSPFGIRTALVMTYAGARGETASEMRRVLCLGLPDDRLHTVAARGARTLTTVGGGAGHRLSLANALWGQTGEKFEPDFLSLTAREYGGGFRELDFRRDHETARQTINHWVAGKTEDRVPELLKKDDINSGVVLVLTNAIYFKGEWERSFPIGGTREADFETTPGARVRVPLMHATGEFRYHAGPTAQAVELPYRGGRLSMVLVLPIRRHGLADVERELTAEALAQLLSSSTTQPGLVALPRFQSKTRYELKNPLVELGMPAAFSGGADFTGIVRPSVMIKKAVHAADITVNEEGTEAAAATAVVLGRSAQDAFSFRADEPFLYLIRDRASGTILFLGRLRAPTRI